MAKWWQLCNKIVLRQSQIHSVTLLRETYSEIMDILLRIIKKTLRQNILNLVLKTSTFLKFNCLFSCSLIYLLLLISVELCKFWLDVTFSTIDSWNNYIWDMCWNSLHSKPFSYVHEGVDYVAKQGWITLIPFNKHIHRDKKIRTD